MGFGAKRGRGRDRWAKARPRLKEVSSVGWDRLHTDTLFDLGDKVGWMPRKVCGEHVRIQAG
jgi:hypothetical protein